jgi:short-subunit dehydrogenase
MKVSNKTIAVTGAGGGVGRELVKELVRHNAKVAAIDLNAAALEDTLKAAGNNKNISLHKVDLTDYDAVKKTVQEIIDTHLQIDGVINNAGIIQPFVPINDLPLERIQLLMNVNFYGTLHMVKAFLPHLLQREEAHILNVSSMGGFLPVPGQVAYGASKAAVTLLSEGLYSELSGTNIKMTVVLPGGINTDIAKNSGVGGMETISRDPKATQSLLTPKAAALQIIEAMEKDKWRVYIGKDAKLMKVLFKFSPKFAIRMINKSLGNIMSR